MEHRSETLCLFFSEENNHKLVEIVNNYLELNSKTYLHVLYILNNENKLFEAKINRLKYRYYNRLIIKDVKQNYSLIERLYFSYHTNIQRKFKQFINSYKMYTNFETYVIVGNSIIADAFVSEISSENIHYIEVDQQYHNIKTDELQALQKNLICMS